MTYSFTAGPDSDPYTERTPYSPEAIRLALDVFQTPVEVFHGVLCMLGRIAESDSAELLAAQMEFEGFTDPVSLGEIRDMLAHWTATPEAIPEALATLARSTPAWLA